MSRESFLARVRQAAAAGRAYRVLLPESIPERAGYQGAGDDLVARMAAEVNAVGGQAQVFDNLAATRDALRELLAEHGVQSALCWQHPVLDQLGLHELLRERNIDRWDYESLQAMPPDDRRARMLAANIGISSATWAVGETGTLAMYSEPGRERVASLLPTVHVAIITAEQILPDLFDLFDQMIANGIQTLPSNLTLITGPSKTGDLELRLTTGVHGPGKWHVLVARHA